MNNQIDRFNLVIDVIDRVPSLGSRAAHVKERMKEASLSNRSYAHEHGIDRSVLVPRMLRKQSKPNHRAERES
jgi:xylulose-5-phosphate/fructose-6-phosphate phosphoketolase